MDKFIESQIAELESEIAELDSQLCKYAGSCSMERMQVLATEKIAPMVAKAVLQTKLVDLRLALARFPIQEDRGATGPAPV